MFLIVLGRPLNVCVRKEKNKYLKASILRNQRKNNEYKCNQKDKIKIKIKITPEINEIQNRQTVQNINNRKLVL